MEITTTKENLVEKLADQMTKNLVNNLAAKDLTDEEREATIVLNKKKIANDSVVIADLVFTALA